MRKLFLIALKDVRLVFRDRAALIFMLLAPFALTLGLGFATGAFNQKNDSGILDLPLVIVNDDQSDLGNAFVEMAQSDELADLLEPQVLTDLAEAKKMVDDNNTVAVVHIPQGFTASIIPTNGQVSASEPVKIELYGNPTSPTSVGIVKNITEQFLTQVDKGRIGGEVAVTQLLTSGAIDLSQAISIGQSFGMDQANATASSSAIQLNDITANGTEVKFNMLALLAPGMALMFLMFTVSNGGKSLLSEQSGGTLPRLLVTPTNSSQVLAGKMLGIFLTGVVQLLILIVGTALLFNLQWGDPLGVLVLVLAAALAATGWGMLLAALCKTPGQVSTIGSAVMLIFGILGGSFTNIAAMPAWVNLLSRLSPNRWGLDGFETLAMGGTLANLSTPLIGLLVMAAVLFMLSVILYNRRGLGKQ